MSYSPCLGKGDLCADDEGHPVDYTIGSDDPLAEDYYYFPNGIYHLIDPKIFNERMTATAKTPRRSGFRRDIIARDGDDCVITGWIKGAASHIFPLYKGETLFDIVVQERGGLYEPDPGLSINSAQNGILITRTLHRWFSNGSLGFLQTPNFAMDVGDVPHLDNGPMPRERLTMQFIVPPAFRRSPIFEDDVQHHGLMQGIPPPSPLLLDFMYGAAIYHRWGRTMEFKTLVNEYSAVHFIPGLVLPPCTSSPGIPESDDSKDESWTPESASDSSRPREGMLKAMDDLIMLNHFLGGKTAAVMNDESQRITDAMDSQAVQMSNLKVREWRTTSET